MNALLNKEKDLLALLKKASPLVVGFSGGVDSALLVQAAVEAVGNDNVVAVTANSASLATSEFEKCKELAISQGWNWMEVETDEIKNPEYVKNDIDRCAHCKTSLFDALQPIAQQSGSSIALGIHLDDLNDFRPGQKTAKDRGGIFPLVEAGFTKHDVRELAKKFNLPVWSKPAMACLSSRIPKGTSVTVGRLKQVESAELLLDNFGFIDFRVRYRHEIGQLELRKQDFKRIVLEPELRTGIKNKFAEIGFKKVTIDISKFR